MKLVLDVENTVTEREGKLHLDPFESDNSLIMVGALTESGDEYLYRMDEDASYFNKIQELLDKTTVLIGHNIVHDLMWLWESNFKYNGDVFDTMLGEYVLQRGQKQALSLEMCAERYNLDTKKQDTLKEYFKQGMGVDEIPPDELSSYLSSDLHATKELYNEITNKLSTEEYSGLTNTVSLTNRVALTLANIYRNGFRVDVAKLSSVKEEFTKEKKEIEEFLQAEVRDFMGDTPINLNSPEQLSWLIYSRKPKDKQQWTVMLSPHMHIEDYKRKVKEHSNILYKTKAIRCQKCDGKGKIRKIRKDGTPFAKENKCPTCNSLGYLFIPTKEIAGMKFTAPNSKWISAHGWSTSKANLELLTSIARQKGMKKAETFLSKAIRLSALDSYLSSFIDGIDNNLKSDNLLHVRLLQHRTATGRFSGADPNMQNMPRGGTFPVKKVFISRWEGGKILEADFAQLEFRTAAYLSQDKTAMKEIEDGFDVHSYTAKVISESGQKTTRQEAKAHTFAPLYGATGFGRTPAEATYYKQFTQKYKGISLWHSKLAEEAMSTRKITTPSGREFSFPFVERRSNGSVTFFTQIKNFPVQSFATADIVPVVLLDIEKQLDKLQSCIVNTVHDSIVIDVHPNEEQDVINVIKNTNSNLKNIIDSQFNINLNVPLELEAKIGNNWLDTKDIA
jgi:DNA polymerase I-like protein with 3'-5' exonuclease and polymerase domains